MLIMIFDLLGKKLINGKNRIHIKTIFTGKKDAEILYKKFIR